MYYITKDQFDLLDFYKRMFELQADTIRGLCEEERPDVVYGFELGKSYNYLREHYIGMMDLLNDIKRQTNEPTINTK